jgi:hypothetical protein
MNKIILVLLLLILIAIMVTIYKYKIGSAEYTIPEQGIFSFQLNDGLFFNAIKIDEIHNETMVDFYGNFLPGLNLQKIHPIYTYLYYNIQQKMGDNMESYKYRFIEMWKIIEKGDLLISHCYIVFISTKQYNDESVFYNKYGSNYLTNFMDIKIITSLRHEAGTCFFTPLGIVKNPLIIHEKQYKNLSIELFKGSAYLIRIISPECLYLITKPLGSLLRILLKVYDKKLGLHISDITTIKIKELLKNDPDVSEYRAFYMNNLYNGYNKIPNDEDIKEELIKMSLPNIYLSDTEIVDFNLSMAYKYFPVLERTPLNDINIYYNNIIVESYDIGTFIGDLAWNAASGPIQVAIEIDSLLEM